jgi:hypothetical protein
MVRATLGASPDWADMQGDAFNAFNEFLRRPLFEELFANPVLRPLLRVATALYGLLELGTDSYTEVVPAPQGDRLW